MVESSPLVGDRRSGEGACRTCHFHGGGSIDEKITAYDSGVGYEVTITDPGPFPLKRSVADIRVTPVGRDRSTIGFTMRFEPKYGPIGWLIGHTVMKSQFKKILRRVIDGLEEHITTGRVVGPKAAIVDGNVAAEAAA
jgi:hypothetical protein